MERQHIRSQLQVYLALRCCAIQPIADNGVAERRQVATNLMLAPCLDSDVQQRAPAVVTKLSK